jgi:cysteine desulfurase
MRVFLDWAAGAPPREEALRAFEDAARAYPGNPSALYAEGGQARAFLGEQRERLARALGADRSRLVFTSGGTESNCFALLPLFPRKGPLSIVLSGIEHPSAHEAALRLERLGARLRFVRPREDGRVWPEDLAKALDKDVCLVSVMAVNNETGAVNDIAGIADEIRNWNSGSGRRVRLHSDCVQLPGKADCELRAMGVDLASFSGHKCGSPRGVGAFCADKGIEPLLYGGSQEGGLRPGTESLPLIASLAESVERAVAELPEARARATSLLGRLMRGLEAIPGACVIPACRREPDDPRYVPQILCLALKGIPGETLARDLDARGVSVSVGSACSSGKKERRVLDQMGVDEGLSLSAIRVSTGRQSTEEDIDMALEALRESAKSLRD